MAKSKICNIEDVHPRCNWEITDQRDFLFFANDPDGWYRTVVKGTGEVYLVALSDMPDHLRENDDYPDQCLTITNVDEMIARLTSLRDLAKEYFGEEWK